MTATTVVSRDGKRVEVMPVVTCTRCGYDTPHRVSGASLRCMECRKHLRGVSGRSS